MSQHKTESPVLLFLLALALSICMLLPALFANVSYAKEPGANNAIQADILNAAPSRPESEN